MRNSKSPHHQKIFNEYKLLRKAKPKGISNEELLKEVVCSNKRMYLSKKEAEEKGFEPYLCDVCGLWHRRTKRETLTQKINRQVRERSK